MMLGPGHGADLRLVIAILFITACLISSNTLAQGGGHTIFGDLTVDETEVEGLKPMSFDIILYTDGGRVVARQAISSKGRYKFTAVPNGNYVVVVELENQEIARFKFNISSSFKNDFRQDIALKWDSGAARNRHKTSVISASESYDRTPRNREIYEKAEDAFERNKYDQAEAGFKEIVANDPGDFQAWSELGTVYLAQKKNMLAETAYLRALEAKPNFFLALMNLGRLRLATNNAAGAIEPLSQAVAVKPTSAEANYFLGEAFLQIKKGSKAVPYLNEAARLGKLEAHLRLATLYNAAGMKDKAAAEYEEFLKKKPDYPERKQLEKYIAENRRK